LSAQIKMLLQPGATPNPRVVVGLLADGPHFVGFNAKSHRLAKPIQQVGRKLDLVHLELLSALVSAGPESDGRLLDRICNEFNAEQSDLEKIVRRYRKLSPMESASSDIWQPSAVAIEDTQDDINASNVNLLEPDRLLVVRIPLLLRLGKLGFEQINHRGQVALSLSAVELSALRYLTKPTTIGQFMQRIADSDERLISDQVKPLLERLLIARLLRSFEPEDSAIEEIFYGVAKYNREFEQVKQSLFKAIERAESRNPIRPGRVPVYPINFEPLVAPLALGFLYTSARQYKDGLLDELFDFRPNWLTDASAPVPEGPAVMLHSHYIWNSSKMLASAERMKAANPLALNIHGGPDVPKYTADVTHYFAEHPYVDIVVHGEGEVTICEILEVLEPELQTREPLKLSVLDGVAGLSYRGTDGQPVRTADRERIKSLDEVPSPYLTGEFDVFAEAGSPSMLLESNRGCPYGCTFCDWGSATTSKIRKFDLDRIFAELEWCSKNNVTDVVFADANFGVFDRDVEIAQHLAGLKKAHGFPIHMGTNYAKNSVKNLKPIIKTLVDADIIAMGLLSLQSMDENTLAVIDRSNIKLSKYEALAREFRDNGLPLYVDLMLGLPGSTPESFLNDLQECMDREVYPKIFPTVLLVNSPMNEPSYREKHGITALPGQVVTSAASFTEDDYHEMGAIRRLFLFTDKFGVLRHALRYARQETGQREIDLLRRLMAAADDPGDCWPALRFTLLYGPVLMVPPVDWGWFLNDLRRFFIEQFGITDDAALDSVLRAQHAMLPAPERSLPETIELSCDYAAWYADIQASREDGHRQDWDTVVAPLRSYGPGTLSVADPRMICDNQQGRRLTEGGQWQTWELSSEIARPSGEDI
jgi:radical SAM superfamily enzyme YgiQ (UPF0313 family)